MLDPKVVISIAIPVIFGQYFYSRFFKKSFKEDYRKFKEGVSESIKNRVKDILDEIKEKIESVSVEELLDTWWEGVSELEAADRLGRRFMEIHDRIEWIYLLLFSSVLAALFALRYPEAKILDYLLSDLALGLLISGLLLFTWNFLEGHKLEKAVLRYEMGIPVEKLIEEELEELEEDQY